MVANPSGIREHLPNIDPSTPTYTNNDLSSVYKQWDDKTKKNVTVSNDPKDYGL